MIFGLFSIKSFNTFHICKLLPIRKNKKEVGLMKNELGGRQMKKICGLRANTYSCLMYDPREI